MKSRTANLLLLFAGAVWGMGFIAQTTAMEDVGPYTFVGLRFIIASIILLPLAFFEERRSAEKLPLISYLQFASIGLMLYAALTLQQVGLLTTTVTNSGVLTGIYVVLTPVLALTMFRQIPHIVVWPCAALTFAGIVLLSGGSFSKLTEGDFLTILCAVASAFQLIFVARYATRYGRPFMLSFIQFATIAVVGTIIGFVLEPISFDIITPALPEIMYAGIFSSAVTFTIQAVAQRYTTAPQAAIFMSTEVLFAALFGAILLGERIGLMGYLGGLLIFTAMILTETIPYIRTKKKA